MSNVVSFASLARAPRVPGQAVPQANGAGALLAVFAHHRRRQGDAWWLKENAELLMILAALGRKPGDLGLAAYQPFYEGAAEMVTFHPQYYRLILGVVTALELLGYPGDLGPRLAQWIAAEGWIESEVNDLQRAEVRHLLARNGVMLDCAGLDQRLIGFLSRPASFALPNPRAAYDLLHVVFYLSDYGRRPIDLPEAAIESLLMLGCLAHLEQNGDLLGEVLLALHYAGQALPPLWRDHLRAETAAFRVETVPCRDSSDAYHNFLVNQWLMGTMGESAFQDIPSAGAMSFRLSRPVIAPLLEWSQALKGLGARRSGDWQAMRAACAPHVSDQALAVADAGAAGSPLFDRFFAHFARAAGPVAPPLRRKLA